MLAFLCYFNKMIFVHLLYFIQENCFKEIEGKLAN